MKRIVIVGGSGFLGGVLIAHFGRQGFEVVNLSRSPAGSRAGCREVTWDGQSLGSWTSELEGADAVINLAALLLISTLLLLNGCVTIGNRALNAPTPLSANNSSTFRKHETPVPSASPSIKLKRRTWSNPSNCHNVAMRDVWWLLIISPTYPQSG